MKCLTCARFSWHAICQHCLDAIPLRPSIRYIDATPIYCFFGYDDISYLLNAKYYTIGSRILSRLSDKAARYFSTSIHPPSLTPSTSSTSPHALSALTIIGIDDYVKSFYSHTGIILHAFAKHTPLRPMYGELRARNPISYAGKPLAYRQANKRDFAYTLGARELVIADDVITTGTSFQEAIRVCATQGANIHFGLALCNAKL